jgi:hypothetical protein
MTDAQQVGRKAENSDALDNAVRVGLVAFGVVHLLVAWLAVQLALGKAGGAKTSSKGAMQYLASQPFGRVLVWAIAIGMFSLVVWRLLEAAYGHRGKDGADLLRARASSVLKALVYGFLGVTAVKVAIGAGSGKGTKGMTAKLLDLPAGPWIVGLVGLGVVGYGANTAWRGWKEKFLEHLDIDGRTGDDGKAFRLFGKIGYIAKGVSLAVVGLLFVYAGVTHDPKKSGGLDQALHKVLQQPFGQFLLLAIAAGLAAYGLFCFARARHLNR